MKTKKVILNKKNGKIIFSGTGKSGAVGAILSSTFSSVGISSFFVDANDAGHGSLGAIEKNDIVICTALIPGKPAPRILTEDLVKLMKPGSIVYDLAAEQGGNSAFSKAGEINTVEGIKIIGVKKLDE